MDAFANKLRPLGLTLLRLAVGIVFLYHGTSKFGNLHQWTQSFVHMGFPSYFAYIAGGLEAGGGALLVLGLFSRVVGLLLAGEMLIAFLRVDLPHSALWRVGGYETTMLLSAVSFIFFCYGAGPVSLDAALGGGGGGRGRRR